ncbi:MAG TPA: VWA domain-containing protein [Pyrinomonadaceae bacterium]
MHHRYIKTRVGLLLSCALLFSSLLPPALSQTATQNPPAAQQDEVLRISTNLVQTDLVVLDKQGRTVRGLTKDQFELSVEGQPQEISFFENVETGSAREAAQLAAARESSGTPNNTPSQPRAAALGTSVGRTFIFFVDDMHLAPEGIKRARDLLNNFVDAMGEDDQALLISPSGQIGFLQQLTGNKTALRLGISRLNYQSRSAPTQGRRAMTVYEALAIDKGHRNVIDYKAKEYMDDMGFERQGGGASEQPQPTPPPPQQSGQPGGGGGGSGGGGGGGGGGISSSVLRVPGTDMNMRRMTAETAVKNEARAVLFQSNAVGEAVLGSLEYVARGSATLPGRKLFFFISDGFILDTRSAQGTERLQRVIDTAARSGVAIYTVDSKGLTVSNVTASQDVFSDIGIGSIQGGGRERIDASTDASSIAMSADSATREILRTLAADTGGRAILNRNDLESGVRQVLTETESYYVLAWKPQVIESGKPKFSSLKVSIKGRSDLKVLSRKGFYHTPPPPLASDNKTTAKDSKTPALKPSEADLRAAISSAFPRRQLGVSVYTTYANESSDSYKIITFADLSNFQLAPGAGGKAAGEVDFAVAVLNDSGKSVTGVGQNVKISESSTQPFRIVATMPNALPAGLYQVRVAARDAQTGRVGSSFLWLEIPKFKAGELALSNILLAEVTGKAGEAPALDVERRFARASSMLIQMFVYNAARSANGQADVAVTLQVLQNGKQLIASPPQPILTAGVADQTRLQYGAQIPLSGFPPGRYTLKVTVNDRAAKTEASQQINITVE